MVEEQSEIKYSKKLLRNKNFMLLWTGQIASKFALSITQLALIWWVISTTGHTAVLGTLLLFIGIPEIFLGPVAGTYVDRWPRKRFIVITDLLTGILVLLMGYLLTKGRLTLPLLAMGMFFVGTFMAFFRPAMMSSVPNLVNKNQLTQANSMVQMTSTLSGLVGPALGGFLIEIVGIAGTFIMMGIVYMISSFFESLMEIPPSARENQKEKPTFWADMKEGIQFIRRDKLILGLYISLGIVSFFAVPIGTLILPTIIEGVLKMSSFRLGLLTSAISTGVLVASLYFGARKKITKKYIYLTIGLLGFGLAFFTMGSLVGLLGEVSAKLTYILLVVDAVFLGLCMGIVTVTVLTLIQSQIPDYLRGKALGFIGTLGGGLVSLAQVVFGFALTIINVSVVLVINGFFVIATSLLMLRLPGFKKL